MHLKYLQERLFPDETTSIKFTVKIFKGDKYYVARVPELGVTTQGKTKEEAKRNLREAVPMRI